MILLDVDVLVEAVMDGAPRHERARPWLEEQLSATAKVALPWTSLTGFVRVVGQPRAWERPLGVETALEIVGGWLARPCVWVPEPGPRHHELLGHLLAPSPSVRLVTDAHLAAIALEHGLELCSRALEHGLELCSRDRDFARWAELGLRSRDPLAARAEKLSP